MPSVSPPAGQVIQITIPGEMRGKGRPRFARRGSFVQTFSDQKTVSAENWVKSCAVDEIGKRAPIEGPLMIDMTITVGIPASWSKKKQQQAADGALRPTGKPDLDNCLKLVADALNGIVWRDDKQIVRMVAAKRYGATPQTVLLVAEVR